MSKISGVSWYDQLLKEVLSQIVRTLQHLKSLPSKMYHLYGNLSKLKHLMPSRKKLPVSPYSNIMTPKNITLCKQIQAQKVLVQYFSKKAIQCNLAVEVSSQTKKYMLKLNLSHLQLLGSKNSVTCYMAKKFKKTKCHSKMCLQRA